MKMKFLNSFGVVVELPIPEAMKRGYYYTIPVDMRTKDIIDMQYRMYITKFNDIIMKYSYASVGALLDFIDMIISDTKTYEEMKHKELQKAIEYLVSNSADMCAKCPYKDMKGTKINSNPINPNGIKVKS